MGSISNTVHQLSSKEKIIGSARSWALGYWVRSANTTPVLCPPPPVCYPVLIKTLEFYFWWLKKIPVAGFRNSPTVGISEKPESPVLCQRGRRGRRKGRTRFVGVAVVVGGAWRHSGREEWRSFGVIRWGAASTTSPSPSATATSTATAAVVWENEKIFDAEISWLWWTGESSISMVNDS